MIISITKNDKFFLITNRKHIRKKETANAVSFFDGKILIFYASLYALL